MSSGYQAAALLRNSTPAKCLNLLVHVSPGAELSLFAEYGSVENEPVAVRPVLQPWTTAANATTYDGTNTWAQRGGETIGTDIGAYVDLVDSVSDGWMDFDVTESVQAAIGAGQNHISR